MAYLIFEFFYPYIYLIWRKKIFFKKNLGGGIFLISHFWVGLPHFWVFLSFYLSNLTKKNIFQNKFGGGHFFFKSHFWGGFPLFWFFFHYIYLIWRKNASDEPGTILSKYRHKTGHQRGKNQTKNRVLNVIALRQGTVCRPLVVEELR